jgi:hypothetical protein
MSIKDTCHEEPHRPAYPAGSEHKGTPLEHLCRPEQALQISLCLEAPFKLPERTSRFISSDERLTPTTVRCIVIDLGTESPVAPTRPSV